jgi:glucose-1-phosphate thymidylyltransferase
MIVTGSQHAGDFLKLLGSGREFGVKFTYRLQDGAGGIAEALSLAEDFIDDGKFAVVLGDNIIEDNIHNHTKEFEKSKLEAKIFLKKVPDAKRFGVAELSDGKVVGIEEKPERPKSDYAVTGLYIYNSDVFGIIKKLKPSARGELEITDVNNAYIRRGTMGYSILKGGWSDSGTFSSLLRASLMAKRMESKKRVF